MPEKGTLIIRTYLSTAQFPVSDATVIISAPNGDGRQKLISILMTDQSGIAGPVSLDAPTPEGSQTPGTPDSAFSTYTLVVEHPDYQLAVFSPLQIFPGVETVQDVPLIPLSPGGNDSQDLTSVTPQPL